MALSFSICVTYVMWVDDKDVQSYRNTYLIVRRGSCSFATKGLSRDDFNSSPFFFSQIHISFTINLLINDEMFCIALNALAVGAAGVVIINSDDTSFSIDDPAVHSALSLPVVMIGKKEAGNLLGEYVV